MVGIWPLPASSIPVVLPADNNRVRYPVDVPAAARKVARMIQHGEIRRRLTVTEEFRERFSWDRIAARWIGVFSSLEVAAK
jgi:glycosyltransferase involved in cell wall biosynthesis